MDIKRGRGHFLSDVTLFKEIVSLDGKKNSSLYL